jgi:hypothetical protein
MAATFHFFTDTNLLSPQAPTDAFGSVGTDGAGHDSYRLSSAHRATSDPTAYAVCSGIVCVQEILGTSPALVNLILKPLDRPPVNFVPVRYYIYKGIRKDSLFNGAAIAAPGTNRLTQAIWDSQNAKNQRVNPPATTAAPAEALGVNLTAASDATNYADSAPIDNLFFRTGVDAQFPVVAGGWKIGTFDKTGFGFAILLDDLGPRHELALTRSLNDYCLVATPTGMETSDQLFARRHDKEKVLRFMDPCAFYGSFYGSRIRAKTSTGTFDVKKGDSLYTDVVARFYNKNIAWLDIRNEHNNSFNYFNNYGPQIAIAYGGTVPPSRPDYYATGWPILKIAGSQFAVNNAKSLNVLRVALPAGDNSRPLLYVSQGYKSTDPGPSVFPNPLTSADKITKPNIQGGWTDEVALAFPNVASSTNAQPVACYTRLKYFKSFDPSQTAPQRPPTTVVATNYLDNIFYPIELQTVLVGNSHVKSAIWDEEVYVDAMTDLGIEFIGKVGIAVDSFNVTFFAFPSFVISNVEGGKTAPLSVVGEAFEADELYLNLLLKKFPGNGIDKSKITPTPPEGSVSAISVIADAATDGKFTSPNFAHFVALVFDKPAYQDFVTQAAASFLAGYRVYLSVKDGVPHNNAAYTTNEVELRGYVLTGGAVTVAEKNTDSASGFTTNVKVYSK